MKTDLSFWQRTYFIVSAALTEPRGILFVFFFFLAWGFVSWDNNLPLQWPVATTTAYAFVTYFAGLFLLDDKAYPWYLGWKAQQGRKLAPYWFSRFNYRILRFVRRYTPSTRQDLFIQNRALQVAKEHGIQLAPDEAPTHRILARAMSLVVDEGTYLKSGKTQRTQIRAHVGRLKTELNKAETPLDGYLRHLIILYLNLSPETRTLVQSHEEESVWRRLDRHPTLSSLFARILAPVIVAFVLYFLGLLNPFQP